jgi:hypothetical protein
MHSVLSLEVDWGVKAQCREAVGMAVAEARGEFGNPKEEYSPLSE